MVSLPPHRVLWPKMMKACSKADLDLLRCELLIQMANEGLRTAGDPNEERVAFLSSIKLEVRRRQQKRIPAEVRRTEETSLAIG